MNSGATISDCGGYRWNLWRVWDDALPLAVFIMLNPSTADGTADDATIRKCMAFARRWLCGGIIVVNLFAKRSTNPDELPYGPLAENDAAGAEMFPTRNLREILIACKGYLPGDDRPRSISVVVAAWGSHKRIGKQGKLIAERLHAAGIELKCLRKSKAGNPWHPLYVPNATELIPY
jgi:hypothetical protein